MVRPIPPEAKVRVIEFWISGLSREQISSKTGVSTGAISNILNEERSQTPDIQELRALNASLKKANISVIDARRGANLLDKLYQLAIPLDRLSEATDFYEQYGDKASETITVGQRLIELEKHYGKSCEEILDTANEMAVDIEERKKTIADLRLKEQTLRGYLREMDSLKPLQEKLLQHGLTIERLDGFIAQNLGLEELGFNLGTASILASELTGYKEMSLDPEKAAAILADDLSQSKSLKEAKASRKKELDKLEEDFKTTTLKKKGLEDQIEILQGQINSLKELQEYEKQTHSKLEKRTKTLEGELVSLGDQKKDLTKQCEDLSGKINDLLEGITESEKLLKDVEDKVKSDERLITIVLMIQDPKTLPDQSSVRRASLAFLEGLLIYVRENQRSLPYSSALIPRISEINKILSTEIRLERRPTT